MKTATARKRTTSIARRRVPHLVLVPAPGESLPPPRDVDVQTVSDLLASARRHQKRNAWLYAPLIALAGTLALLGAHASLPLVAAAALVLAMIGNRWLVRRRLDAACRVYGIAPAALRRALDDARAVHGHAPLRALTPPAREHALSLVVARDLSRSAS